jgi:hypothetical protein
VTLDPTTNLGRLRLRCGDYSDMPWLPDSVYNQTLIENDNNLVRSAKTCAQYILGQLSFKTHRKIGLQAEVWGGEAFAQYKQFLLLTVTNPNFMDISPIPVNLQGTALHPLMQFTKDWNLNYAQITQSEQLSMNAIGSPSSAGGYWEWPA